MDELELYSNAASTYLWVQRTFDILMRTKDAQKFSKQKWDSMVSEYFMDILNFKEDSESIYKSLVLSTCRSTGISREEVEDIFLKTFEFSLETTEVPNLIRGKDGVFIRPIRMAARRDSSRAAYLRYSFVSGSDEYNLKIKEFKGRTLECFASPFDYTLNDFCSLFPEDKEEVYPPGYKCYGNFFDYIDILENDPENYRLIVNPPHTERIINKTCEKLIMYFLSHPKAEMICVFPDWKLDSVEGLLKLKGTASKKKDKMIFVVNFGSNEKQSNYMLNEIIEN